VRRRLSATALAVAVAVVGGSFSLTGAGAQSAPNPAQVGRFLAPFEDTRPGEGPEACHTDADGRELCKPAGAWTVPLEQAGRRAELRGETVWKPVSRAGG
jgi:hypothetical protein